jgi:hypothetical protein
MSNGFSVTSKVSLRLGKGLDLKLLLYARPAFGLRLLLMNGDLSSAENNCCKAAGCRVSPGSRPRGLRWGSVVSKLRF